MNLRFAWGSCFLPKDQEHFWEDGGKCATLLDKKKIGEFIDIDGPFGHIEYIGPGEFKVPGGFLETKHVAMMAEGSGLTPMLQMVTAALRNPYDTCHFSLLYANKYENDILCHEILEHLVASGGGRFKLTYNT